MFGWFDAIIIFIDSLVKSTDIMLIIFAAVFISFIVSALSVMVKIAVGGYPRASFIVFAVNFLIGIFIFVVGYKDSKNYQKTFTDVKSAALCSLGVFMAIIGLYAVLLNFLRLRILSYNAAFKEATAALGKKIADVKEVEAFSVPVSINTEKMGTKQPRVDDSIDYFRLEKFIAALDGEDLSPIEKATLKMAERTINHHKNTAYNNSARSEINSAFYDIVKLSAKYKK